MPKPIRQDIVNAWYNAPATDAAISAIMEVIDRAWEERDADAPSVDEVVGILSEARLADDVERFNELQRARREAYARGLVAMRITGPRSPTDDELACARTAYPLKKRVPKVIPDPHGAGWWTTRMDGGGMHALHEPTDGKGFGLVSMAVMLTPERISVIQQMFSDPWEWGDCTSAEDGEA